MANLRSWLRAPLGGLVVGGSTGEAPLLNEIELLRLVEWACSLPLGERLLIAGTGAESTRQTVRLCRESARLGADAVLVRPPSYYRDRMTPAAVQAHYRMVADASPLPVLLYHIPKYVPVDLRPDVVGRLSRHENIVGIKDSSGELRNLGALVDACGDRASVLVGSGTLLYGGMETGAVGGVLAVGLLAPGLCTELLEAWEREDMARAGTLQERIGPLHRKVVGRHGVAGVKAALDLLGLDGGGVRSPLTPLESGDREAVVAACRDAGLELSSGAGTGRGTRSGGVGGDVDGPAGPSPEGPVSED